MKVAQLLEDSIGARALKASQWIDDLTKDGVISDDKVDAFDLMVGLLFKAGFTFDDDIGRFGRDPFYIYLPAPSTATAKRRMRPPNTICFSASPPPKRTNLGTKYLAVAIERALTKPLDHWLSTVSHERDGNNAA